jgi:hypothetical protein
MLTVVEAEIVAARELLVPRGTFDGWLVGFAAAPTDDLRAFYTILSQPDGASIGEYLVEHGASGGIAYGLCLLYMLDMPTFSKRVSAFRSSQTPINVRSGGCSPLSEPSSLGAVVRDIESGKYPAILRRICDIKFEHR